MAEIEGIYETLINSKSRMSKASTDPKRFARMVMDELEDITAQLADLDNDMIMIDGSNVDKTTASGQLVINNKLSEIENLNTQNFNLISFVQKIEDSLRQMMG
jgi:hypothetical protein